MKMNTNAKGKEGGVYICINIYIMFYTCKQIPTCGVGTKSE